MTTKQAAAALALRVVTVQAHIKRGRIKATKIGRDWHITADEVARFARERRGRGRPKQRTTEEK